MIVRIASIALLLAVLPAFAEAQAEPLSGWFTDAKTGCKSWDGTPDARESMSWSGNCVKGLADGSGVLQWFDNGKPTAHYVGVYQAGKMNDHGIFSMANGDRYEGEFSDDQFNGRGVYNWAAGERYDGMWQDDKPNGQGTKTNRAGEVFSGMWTNGCFKQDDRRATAHATDQECSFK